MLEARRSLTSLLVGAGVAMVAISSMATVALTSALTSNGVAALNSFFLMVACSSSATIFVLSHLHSELGAREQNARTEARTDPLTGLHNRKALIEALNRLIHSRYSSEKSSWLVLIDLNNFKNVNDSLGHEAGDELLAQVANRLRANLPPSHVFRLGGDEFAVVFCGLTESEVKNRCRRLHQEIAGSYALTRTHAGIGCSLGIAEVDAGLTSSDLMRRADLAMYKAKKSRSFVEVFDLTMLAELRRKGELAKRLTSALESGKGINLKYQPIFSPDGGLNGLEVYFRWHDEQFGAVPPREAIQIARLTQQIDSLGLFVVSRAIHVLEETPGLKMCINIEAMQILDTRFAEALELLVVSSGQDASSFQLEIEETELDLYGAKVAPVLRGLADSGFTIAVDNFGAGTSSLTELKSLGFTALKLDQSLLASTRQSRNISLLKAKVNLAATLGMKVTCKGIGDMEDEAIAIQAGCDYLQGFKYGRPDNANAFTALPKNILLSATG